MLSENDLFLSTIYAFQRDGTIIEALELQRRLHKNMSKIHALMRKFVASHREALKQDMYAAQVCSQDMPDLFPV